MAGGVATAPVEVKVRIEDILNRMDQYRPDLDEDLRQTENGDNQADGYGGGRRTQRPSSWRICVTTSSMVVANTTGLW